MTDNLLIERVVVFRLPFGSLCKISWGAAFDKEYARAEKTRHLGEWGLEKRTQTTTRTTRTRRSRRAS
jgi:hypothetical protein